ncbi:hypothetical protein LTR10_017118 [Elasticomyces elasticus]|uniref:Uncharacterized protein n=1 Tax=Exophiala sideris TaxID=1016849 RepID=A0ABR0JDY1_9EURO|nr:hypothetical protein LTR10_017118 [Elasticomyces elasticus]KAK5032585.1 hypothetical protein LTS07_003994 [Exophiala sideris]KAK5037235.1 hypothetical protein LTR13_005041 [Exophiala sideris]KAK5062110.1 hypothetical protein LTR69_004467 [Exophiala sideris]KAK5182393.1 hypothetical protein LTR44_005405 [Eurotiomycetes sp. CCFEE 6388]
MDSFRQVYRLGTPFKKSPGFYNAYVIDGSFFNIHETKAVKPIKDMYSPHFSRAAIQKLEEVIHAKITKLLNALHMASQESKIVDLTLAFKCLTADVVMEYCYQRNFGALDATDFHFKIIEDMEGLFGTASYTWYFPNLFNLLCRILEHAPVSVTKVVAKPLAASFEIYKVMHFTTFDAPRLSGLQGLSRTNRDSAENDSESVGAVHFPDSASS